MTEILNLMAMSIISVKEHVKNLMLKLALCLYWLIKKIVMQAYIESQYGYCPLIWMLYSWSHNNKINRIHKRELRISSSFQKFLKRDNSATIHHRNIMIWATETYKFLKGLFPPFKNEICVERNNNCSFAGE